MGKMDKEKAFELLDAYFEAGGNFIDTANAYQNEQSEKWIGEWMKARGNRDQLVIASKFSMDYRAHEMGKNKNPNLMGNHRRSIIMSLRDSLEKLQTDWIDIIYLHFWDYTTSIEEVMDSLDTVVQKGQVHYLGISDTPAWIVSAANTYAKAHAKTPFVIYQGRYNILRRDLEREILPMVRHFGMALAPWEALGGGRFQTKEALEEKVRQGENLRSFFGKEQTEDEAKISAALEKVAKEHDLDSITTVALAYVLSKAPYVFPIVGGRKVEHLKDNIRALSIKLTKDQIKELEQVIEFDVGFPANILGSDPAVSGEPSSTLGRSAMVDFVQSTRAIGYEEF